MGVQGRKLKKNDCSREWCIEEEEVKRGHIGNNIGERSSQSSTGPSKIKKSSLGKILKKNKKKGGKSAVYPLPTLLAIPMLGHAIISFG